MAKYRYEDQLESARLKTRWLTAADVVLWAPFFDDPESTAFVPAFDLPTSEAKAQLWIEKQLERYKEQRYGLQALIEKDSGKFIGLCGLLSQEVDGRAELEVGYHILKANWGKGYAPEAAKLFMDYAFDHNLAQTVISIIDTKNTKSQRVAEKNGLERGEMTRWCGLEIYTYRTKERLMMPAVAALIEGIAGEHPALLMQKRCKGVAEGNGVYEVPGGKVRAGENVFACLRREVREECGLSVAWIDGETEAVQSLVENEHFNVMQYTPFASAQNTAGRYPVMVQAFICKAEGTLLLQSNESEDIRWVPLSELANRLDRVPESFFAMHLAILRQYIKHKGF